MHPIMYVMLIAAVAHAFPEYLMKRETVPCPVCQNSSSFVVQGGYEQHCTIRGSDDKKYKICINGAYNNPGCDNRRDCYRALHERCTENEVKCDENLYYCDPKSGTCKFIPGVFENFEQVECPVCDNSSGFADYEQPCPIERSGKTYKECPYGAYDNPACGNRRDCYRALDERCTDNEVRCENLYYCGNQTGKCITLPDLLG